MKDKIENMIMESIKEIGQDTGNSSLQSPTLETKLFGQEGAMDSLTLVTLIAMIEEKISQELNEDIIIADEKAMSQSRSPFLTGQTLSDYIQTLIKG